MVGSSDSIGDPNTILNTIVAQSFCDAADRLEAADDFDLAVHDLIKEYMTKHQRIIFNGNGYAPEWVEEAKRRGLPNIPTMLDAVETLTTEKSIALFEKFGIFTQAELESRKDVLYETFAKTIHIEGKCMMEMAKKKLVPAIVFYAKELSEAVIAAKGAGVSDRVQRDLLEHVTALLEQMQDALVLLESEIGIAEGMKDHKECAFFYRDRVKVAMEALRAPADELEKITDKEIWPFPTYGDLLFEV